MRNPPASGKGAALARRLQQRPAWRTSPADGQALRESTVLIQVNTDALITGDLRTVEYVETSVRASLERFGPKITRVEVYLNDENGGTKEGGNDKVARVEVKIAGLPSHVTSHSAGAVADAFEAALEKMERHLDRVLGKIGRAHV